MVFGGYEVWFSSGAEPVYLKLAWPTGTDPSLIKITQDQAMFEHRDKLAGLDGIAIERSERNGITYEVYLYGKPGYYKAEPIVEWPEEIDV